jgi:hypothetical protein
VPETPEWRRALRDIASIGTGVFLLFHEALAQEPREIVMYVGAVLLVGPGVLRSLGK